MRNLSAKSMILECYVVLAIGFLLFCGLDAFAQTKPNIVFILVDDMPGMGLPSAWTPRIQARQWLTSRCRMSRSSPGRG